MDNSIPFALLFSAVAALIALLSWSAGRARAHREEGAELATLRAEVRATSGAIDALRRETLDKLAVRDAEERAAESAAKLAEERDRRRALEAEINRLRGDGRT